MRKIFLQLTIILFANLLEAQTPPCFSTFGETHTFSLGWYSGQMNANAIIKDDFNNDGILDLATSNSGSWSISIVSHTLHLDNFANGIYFVNLYQNNRIVKREKVILNK